MHFYKSNVKVSSAPPPEEILASHVGGCGLWQIAVMVTAVVSQLISASDRIAVRTSVPNRINFTCADENNASQCLNANGTICEKFIFFQDHSNVVTFTEKLDLVCEKEVYASWIKNCYRLGLIVGYLLAGGCVDRFGLKITTMVFISVHCLSGLLVISVRSEAILIFFMLSHGIFSVGIKYLPVLSVCDTVGNNWRTLALGAVALPESAAVILYPFFQSFFSNAEGVLATVSVMPLVILIPLLYYKDSPNYISLMDEFPKGEEILRQIAQFNRRPISPNIKVRPVQILIDNKIPEKTTFFHIWTPLATRKTYISVVIIALCMGYSNSILQDFMYNDFANLSIMGASAFAGCVLSIALLHLVRHKVVIAVFDLLKCGLISGLIAYFYQNDSDNKNLYFVLLLMATVLVRTVSETASLNVVPRLFPTELRAVCLGVCGSIYHIGSVIERIIHFYTRDNSDSYVIIISVLVLSSTLQIVACFWIWDVHKRELPDFLVDCVKFNECYKPTRYYSILDNASRHEIEVIQVDLNAPPPKRRHYINKSRP